jgi:hypothetical protein
MELRFLTFTGPNKAAAEITFKSGLNILYGPSNTGKSSIVDAIDFMFGRERLLVEKPEHEGYERVLMGLSFAEGDDYTLVRSIQGGDFECFEGLFHARPSDIEPEILKVKRPTKKIRTISSFIFESLNIGKKKFKKNAKNDVVSLTLRNSIALALINETEIQKEGSPYFHQGFTKVTEEASRLKFFLTGVDDSSLLPEEKEKKVVSRAAKVELLAELIKETEEEIVLKLNDEQTYSQLTEQSKKLGCTLDNSNSDLESSELKFESCSSERKELLIEINLNENRLSEINSMTSRFNLLDEQYSTDISRLDNISESGTLFMALPNDNCPLCGKLTIDRVEHEKCDGNLDVLVEAATSEKIKLESLKEELAPTLTALENEAGILDDKLVQQRTKSVELKEEITKINASLNSQKTNYKELVDKKIFLSEALKLHEQKQLLEEKLENLLNVKTTRAQSQKNQNEPTLPTNALYNLSTSVKALLNSWKFPMATDVYFDKEKNDFVLSGKHRSSNGKGYRALTHAAASLGLMKYLEDNTNLSHFGFVLLDSPLLAYEKPENLQDDLTGTDVNLKFFECLSKWKTKQVIVIENKKSIPEAFSKGKQITQFTGTNEGRGGFFPT